MKKKKNKPLYALNIQSKVQWRLVYMPLKNIIMQRLQTLFQQNKLRGTVHPIASNP